MTAFFGSDDDDQWFKTYLISKFRLGNNGVRIYFLGLERWPRPISSRDVIEKIKGMRQATAGDLLRRLAKLGFFRPSLPDANGEKGGRGRVRWYKAEHPKNIVKPVIIENLRLFYIVENFDEDRELQTENMKDPDDPEVDDIWQIKSEDTAMAAFADMICNASKSVKIYSHDCSWLNIPDVKDALKKCVSRKVTVEVATTDIRKNEKETLNDYNVKLWITDVPGVPFIIADDSTMLVSRKYGNFSSKYLFVEEKNKYVIRNTLNLFEYMCNTPKKGGDR